MAVLTPRDLFGQGMSLNVDPDVGTADLIIVLNNFKNTDDGGQILNNLGISDLNDYPSPYNDENTPKGANILYAILLLIIQNQADNINADPEQKIFVSEQPVRLASGSRSGQIQRSFSVNFFSAGNVSSRPDIDDI